MFISPRNTINSFHQNTASENYSEPPINRNYISRKTDLYPPKILASMYFGQLEENGGRKRVYPYLQSQQVHTEHPPIITSLHYPSPNWDACPQQNSYWTTAPSYYYTENPHGESDRHFSGYRTPFYRQCSYAEPRYSPFLPGEEPYRDGDDPSQYPAQSYVADAYRSSSPPPPPPRGDAPPTEHGIRKLLSAPQDYYQLTPRSSRPWDAHASRMQHRNEKADDPWELSERLLALCAKKNITKEDTREVKHLLQNRALNINACNKNGQTPLHLLASSPSKRAFEIAKLLLDAGADLNRTDANLEIPLEALIEPEKNEEWARLFLRKRGKIDSAYVYLKLDQCIDRYSGSYRDRKADRDLLDNVVTQLAGFDVTQSWRRKGEKYGAHLQSIAAIDRGEGIENMEGLNPQISLVLRIRILTELIVKIQTGVIAKERLPLKTNVTLRKLEQELILNLQTLRLVRDQFFVRMYFKHQSKVKCFEAIADNLANKIRCLEEGETFCILGGDRDHAIYGTFTRHNQNTNKILVRWDNTGNRIDTFHEFDPKDKSRVYPSAFLLDQSYFVGSPSSAAQTYLFDILFAKNSKKLQLVALDMNYGELIGCTFKSELQKKEKTDQDWPSSSLQTVGNCTVKSHNVGLQIRWRDNTAKHPDALYKWFREQEVTSPLFVRHDEKRA